MSPVWPTPELVIPGLSVISSFSEHTMVGNAVRVGSQIAASAAWPSANLGMFVPFVIDTPIEVVRLWSYNGGTVSGNLDIGILDRFGARLLSTGSTAQSGTSTVQAITVTATRFEPGQYILGLACSNTTATFFRVAPSTATLAASGMRIMASAMPIPATVTPATPTSSYCPIFGLGCRTVL